MYLYDLIAEACHRNYQTKIIPTDWIRYRYIILITE